MNLREWIHPGWFVPYDWWCERRLEHELEVVEADGLPPAEEFGFADLDRRVPGQVLEVPAARSLIAARPGTTSEVQYIEQVSDMMDKKLHRERQIFDGRLEDSRDAEVGRWWCHDGFTFVVTRIEDGSWRLWYDPSATATRRIWGYPA